MLQQPPNDTNCIFCKILNGTIPCSKIYENAYCLAFLDINPTARGHTLIVPKKHYNTVLDVPEEYAAPLFEAIKKIGKALMTVTGAEGFNCLQNNFEAAGQVVWHAHWHVIPRFDKDGIVDWPAGHYNTTTDMLDLAKTIQSELM